MELARNAVFAVNSIDGINRAFLYVNRLGNISPFWVRGDRERWSLHGEFFGESERDNGHSHWHGVCDGNHQIELLQSHVTKASGVDFKRARKYYRRHK